MDAIAGPFTVASVVLALAGAMKVADPAPTAGALKAVGLPSGRVAVRGLGLAELVAGLAALVLGGALAAGAVAVFYAGFAAFVAVALRAATPLASCGCFGRQDTPPSLLHLVVDVVFVGVAVAAAARRFGPVDAVLADQAVAESLAFGGLVGVGTYATSLALGPLPRLLALTGPRRRPATS